MKTNLFIPLHIAIVLLLLFTTFKARSNQAAMIVVQQQDSIYWIDSVYNSLSTEQRIAQLFNIRVYSNKNEDYYRNIDSIISKHQPGGITFFQGGPYRQVILTNRWQKLSTTPLLVAMDAENGPAMRLDSIIAFPNLMTLGAIRDDSLIYQIALAIGQQCKRLGIHINFAPVADINNNPLNPVINYRSSGENPSQVAHIVSLFINGMHQAGIMTTLKHFPGHGDTEIDSHYGLPVIKKSFRELEATELVPFTNNLSLSDAVMIGHISLPSLDTVNSLPASLSPIITDHILRDILGFKGLIITDALDMKGVGSYQTAGEKELLAFLAGNDILLLPEDLNAAIQKIKNVVDSALVPYQFLEEKCKRILAYKYKAGLYNIQPIKTENLLNDLNQPHYTVLIKEAYRKAITLINQPISVPIHPNHYEKIIYIPIHDENIAFDEEMKILFPHDKFPLPTPSDTLLCKKILDTIENYDLLILTLSPPSSLASKNYGLNSDFTRFINALPKNKSGVMVIFGSPYIASALEPIINNQSILITYQNNPFTGKLAAHALYGANAVSGHLPVGINREILSGTGIETETLQVLGFSSPKEVNVDEVSLTKIDEIAIEGIENGAYSGCQILLARHGKVFYYKSFGHLDINHSIPVKNSDLYDLASITKIAATTLVTMKLFDENKIDNDTKLKDLLPKLENRKLYNTKVIDIMYHQAGLFPWIAYYKATLENGSPSQKYYRTQVEPGFEVPVAKNLYLRNDYIDTIISIIDRTPLGQKGQYKYSDLGFILLRFGYENLTKTPFEEYLYTNFYHPMGLSSMVYNPLRWFKPERIAPTLIDTEFRKQLLHGYVHDPAAAMLGGVSGHAGLFSHAFDLARIMQMLLWEGEYNHIKFFEKETVHYFTSAVENGKYNRRGLGFDKPPKVSNSFDGPVCSLASPNSFGHSGFTGTYVWADPDHDLIYVFLSNRIHPSDQNEIINKLNIRTRIHQAAYEALIDY